MLFRLNWPIASALALLLAVVPAQASRLPDAVEARLPLPSQTGAATVRLLGIPIYSAALFTNGGSQFDWAAPFALELSYEQTIGRDKLLSATLSEMQRMEGAQADHSAIIDKLTTCFRDVARGDRIVALAEAADRVGFWYNGTQTCQVQHPNIRDRFLGIWLSDASRFPKLSRQLRGAQ